MLNPACFDFLLMLVETKRVIGGVSHEPCGSGSVVRHRKPPEGMD
jgi:hypothetical protein